MRTRRVASALALIMACAPVAGAGDAPPDLARRRIVTREIPQLPAELEQALPPKRKTQLVWNDLVLDGVPAPILLGRSFAEYSTDGSVATRGFDRRSLRLSWLEPGKLLLITWGTDHDALTNQRREGTIVLLRNGDRFRELFRDAIYSFGSVGGGNSMAIDLVVRWDPTTETMTLTRIVREHGTAETEEVDSAHGGHDKATRYLESTRRDVWTSRLVGDHLEQVGSARYFDLAERTPVGEVADEAGISVDELVRLNPELERNGSARGRIRVAGAIAPYKHENEGISQAPVGRPAPAAVDRARVRLSDCEERTLHPRCDVAEGRRRDCRAARGAHDWSCQARG